MYIYIDDSMTLFLDWSIFQFFIYHFCLSRKKCQTINIK